MSTGQTRPAVGGTTLYRWGLALIASACLVVLWPASMAFYGGALNIAGLFHGVAWAGASPLETVVAACCTWLPVAWLVSIVANAPRETHLFWATCVALILSHGADMARQSLAGTEIYSWVGLGLSAVAGFMRLIVGK